MKTVHSIIPETKISAPSNPQEEEAKKSLISCLTAQERHAIIKRAEMFAGKQLTAQERTELLVQYVKQQKGREKANAYLQGLKNTELVLPMARELYTQKQQEAAVLIQNGVIEEFVIDKNNKEVYGLLCLYFANDFRFEQKGFSLDKGILLCGATGSGKTTLAKLFSTNPRHSYNVVRCKDIAREFSAGGSAGGWERIDRYTRPAPASTFTNPYQQPHRVWCYDDLGSEATANRYGQHTNLMQDIIMDIADRGNVCFATTNLSVQELLSDNCYPDPRFASRCKRLFNVLALYGEDRRDIKKI